MVPGEFVCYYSRMFETSHTSISISTGTMVRAVLILVGLFLIWFLRDLVLIVLTSIVIASFVESAIPPFRKRGLNRAFSVAILYAVAIIFFAGLFYMFAPLLITEIYNFSTTLSTFLPGVSFLEYFKSSAFSGAKEIVDNLSHNFSITSLFSVSKVFIDNLSLGFFQTLSVAFGGIFNLILIIIISFYLSIDEKGIENFLRIILPARYENYVVDLWERSRRKIALWVKGQMLLGFVVAVLIYLMLSLLDVDYALILAIIAGLMEMVPYGVLVAVVPAIALSYLDGGVSTSLMVAAAYFIVHQFEVFLFAPIIIKKIVGLSPIVIILSVLIGFEVASFWGAVIAIPVAVFVMELVSDIEKRKALAREKD